MTSISRAAPRIAWAFGLLWAGLAAGGEPNLLLAHADAQGVPRGKKVPGGAAVRVENDLLTVEYAKNGSLTYGVYITPDHRRLLLTGELETRDLVPGDADWKNGRLAMRFVKEDGKMAGPWPSVYAASGTKGPMALSRVYNVPPDAAMLLVEPSHFGVSGSVAFRRLSLTEAPENLLLAPNPDGIAREGFVRGAVTAAVRDGDKLSITIGRADSYRMEIPLDPSWKTLKLSFRWKTEDIRRGDADWKDARIAMRFHGPAGTVGAWPKIFNRAGTSDWTPAERSYEIPEGATRLSFEPANFGVDGVVRFEDLSLTLETLR